MIESAHLGLRIAGVYCIDFPNANTKISTIKRTIFLIWHYIALFFLIIFTIVTSIAVFLSNDQRLTLIVDFLRISSALYRSLILKFQKTRLKQLLIDIDNSLSLFPEVSIREYNYCKTVILVTLYSSIQGIQSISI